MKYCRKYSLGKPAAIFPILFALVCALAVGAAFFVAFEFMYSAEALSGGRGVGAEDAGQTVTKQAVATGEFAGIPAVIEANWGQFGRRCSLCRGGRDMRWSLMGRGWRWRRGVEERKRRG